MTETDTTDWAGREGSVMSGEKWSQQVHGPPSVSRQSDPACLMSMRHRREGRTRRTRRATPKRRRRR